MAYSKVNLRAFAADHEDTLSFNTMIQDILQFYSQNPTIRSEEKVNFDSSQVFFIGKAREVKIIDFWRSLDMGLHSDSLKDVSKPITVIFVDNLGNYMAIQSKVKKYGCYSHRFHDRFGKVVLLKERGYPPCHSLTNCSFK